MLNIPIRRVLPLDKSNGKMNRRVKLRHTLNDPSSDKAKELTDQVLFDQRSHNVEIDYQIN